MKRDQCGRMKEKKYLPCAKRWIIVNLEGRRWSPVKEGGEEPDWGGGEEEEEESGVGTQKGVP